MDKDFLNKKINVCKRLGGKPEDLGNDIHCEGVDEIKFEKELKEEK